MRRNQKANADDGEASDDHRRVREGRGNDHQSEAGDTTREGGEGESLFHAFRYAYAGSVALTQIKALQERPVVV